MDRNGIPPDVRQLLEGQTLAVLSTHRGGQPYGSLVGYAASADLRHLWFATPRATRKYANLAADGRTAMLIDNRGSGVADFHAAMACTAVGSARELAGPEHAAALAIYLAKLPHLEGFVRSPSCALFGLAVVRYVVVTRFQEVTEYSPA